MHTAIDDGTTPFVGRKILTTTKSIFLRHYWLLRRIVSHKIYQGIEELVPQSLQLQRQVTLFGLR